MMRTDEESFFRESWIGLPRGSSRPGWRASSAGLDFFANALRAKLVLIVLASCLGLLAVGLQSAMFRQGVALCTPLASLLVGVGMCVGIARFTRFPDRIPGRGMAYAALSLLVLSLVADGYAALLAVTSATAPMVASADAGDVSGGGPLAATWRLPWALAASQVLGLAALGTLLASFRALGRGLGAHELVQRAGRAMGFLAIVGAFVIELRYAEFRGLLRPEIFVPAAMLVLVLSLVSVAKALGTVRFLEAYLLGLGGDRESGVPIPLSAWRNA